MLSHQHREVVISPPTSILLTWGAQLCPKAHWFLVNPTVDIKTSPNRWQISPKAYAVTIMTKVRFTFRTQEISRKILKCKPNTKAIKIRINLVFRICKCWFCRPEKMGYNLPLIPKSLICLLVSVPSSPRLIILSTVEVTVIQSISKDFRIVITKIPSPKLWRVVMARWGNKGSNPIDS